MSDHEPTYRPSRELSPLEEADLATVHASLLPTLQRGKPSVWATLALIALFAVPAVLLRAYWFLSLPLAGVALFVAVLELRSLLVDRRGHLGYPDRATWTLCEQPEHVLRVRYKLTITRVYRGNKHVDERAIVETALGETLHLAISGHGARELIAALGRWCPNAAIEVPATWDGGLPEDPPIVLRQAAALPQATVRRAP